MTRLLQIALLLAIIIPFGMATNARAGDGYYINGNNLHESCVKRDPLAIGYVMGVVDGVRLQQLEFEGKMNICLPPGATSGQIRDVVCKFLDRIPAQRHHPAVFSVGSALIEAFPCRKKQ